MLHSIQFKSKMKSFTALIHEQTKKHDDRAYRILIPYESKCRSSTSKRQDNDSVKCSNELEVALSVVDYNLLYISKSSHSSRKRYYIQSSLNINASKLIYIQRSRKLINFCRSPICVLDNMFPSSDCFSCIV